MNLIFNGVPTDVKINGHSYLINSDFRVGMQFEKLTTELIDEGELLEKALKLFFPICPSDTSAAVDVVIWFYNCGKAPQQSAQDAQGTSSSKPIYNYDFDAAYIYAAFLQQYNINLISANLHWWQFRAMFLAISSETTFSKIMSYRSTDISKLKGDEKERLESLKEIYKLPTAAKVQENTITIKQRLSTTGKLD